MCMTQQRLPLSLSPSAFKQCRMHKPVPQGGVTEFWTRYMCLFLTQLSCCCAQPLQQACCSTWAPIMPHKSAKFTLMLHIAAQTSSTPCYSNPTGQSWTQLPRENVQVEAAQATQGAHGQACRDGIRKINVQVEWKLKFPLELRNVKGSKSFTSPAATKGRPKTEWAHCWSGMVRKKLWNAQKNLRYLMPSLPRSSLARSPLRSPTLLRLHSGERNTTRVRQIRDKMHLQAGQNLHPWFTRAEQCHSFLEFSSE